MSTKIANRAIRRPGIEPKSTQSEAAPPPVGEVVVLARVMLDILEYLVGVSDSEDAANLYNTNKGPLEELVR